MKVSFFLSLLLLTFVVCRDMILRQIAPHLHIPYSINYQTEDHPIVPTMYGTMYVYLFN